MRQHSADFVRLVILRHPEVVRLWVNEVKGQGHGVENGWALVVGCARSLNVCLAMRSWLCGPVTRRSRSMKLFYVHPG